MKRRGFIMLPGGTAVAWPLAEQVAMPVIGYLDSTVAVGSWYQITGFRQDLNAAGFVKARNVAIECRWVREQLDRLPKRADDPVQRNPAVIATMGASLPHGPRI